jgi:hypothetical protein
MNNWMELQLTEDEEQFVKRNAELYQAAYVRTLDTILDWGRSIEILRKRFLSSGIQGEFTQALVQYGFTARDGGPMVKSLRSNLKDLFDHEAEVRAWWAKVPEKKRRYWLSIRAVHNNWKASLKPPEAPRKPDSAPVTRATEPARRETQINPASFSMTAQQKLEAYKRQIKRELEAQFEDRVRAEAEQLFDTTLRSWHARLEAAERQIKEFDRQLDRRKPIISRPTWRAMLAGVQPDRGGTHTAAVEVNTNKEAIEAALCGSEAEQRKWALPSGVTLAEMMENRAAYDAKNRERAKRAAATRKQRAAEKANAKEQS